MGKHFFKSLEIENFRGIRKSEINGFSRVNLFVGENNCGKTTVLESLFLLSGISKPDLILAIQNNLRNIVLTEPRDIRDFFFKQEHENGFHLKGIQEAGKRKLTVKPFYGNPYVNQADSEGVGAGNGDESKHISKTKIMGTETDGNLSGFECEFSVSDGKNGKPRKYHSRVATQWIAPDKPANFQPSIDKRYKEKSFKKCAIHKSEVSYDPIVVDRILDNKQKGLLLEALHLVEPKILDIKVGPTKVISADIGYSSFIPINLLGDGLAHIMSVVSNIFDTAGGILMIDEIGAGLHVSCLELLWQIIIGQSRKLDTQIFMTTHSKDVIESLAKFYYNQESSVSPDDKDAVACFYLNKDSEDQVKGYRYSPEQVRQALESGTDIRH